ncbi:spore germination protein GerW family protein [Streptomyces sp. NPDC052492]|uniref:spore germination protein GerW family protein n=1 Tax=unclassified Streptomyces TaxID=2593676 RepID=UPI0033ADBF05
MTDGERDNASGSAPDADLSAALVSVRLLERLADRLGGRAAVTAVYGQPVTVGGVTVVPVAAVGFGFGGGAGQEVGTTRTADGGGGGGAVGAKPLGYIEIRDGAARYQPIRAPWRDVALPLSAVVLANALPKVIRALRWRRRPGRGRG